MADKCCANCFWHEKGDGIIVHADDIVCVNAESIHCAEFTGKDHYCDKWERQDSDERRKDVQRSI